MPRLGLIWVNIALIAIRPMSKRHLLSKKVTFAGPDASAAQALWNSRHKHLANSVEMARNLQSEPASSLYPQSFVDRVSAAFKGIPNIKN